MDISFISSPGKWKKCKKSQHIILEIFTLVAGRIYAILILKRMIKIQEPTGGDMPSSGK
jgi:hypothetical protein